MSDHVKKPDLMRQRTLQGLMLLLLFAIGSLGTLHAEESKQPYPALLDEIWPFELPHKRPLSKQDQEYAEAALIQWLRPTWSLDTTWLTNVFFGMIEKNQHGAR